MNVDNYFNDSWCISDRRIPLGCINEGRVPLSVSAKEGPSVYL